MSAADVFDYFGDERGVVGHQVRDVKAMQAGERPRSSEKMTEGERVAMKGRAWV
jgi:hypothetical protein